MEKPNLQHFPTRQCLIGSTLDPLKMLYLLSRRLTNNPICFMLGVVQSVKFQRSRSPLPCVYLKLTMQMTLKIRPSDSICQLDRWLTLVTSWVHILEILTMLLMTREELREETLHLPLNAPALPDRSFDLHPC